MAEGIRKKRASSGEIQQMASTCRNRLVLDLFRRKAVPGTLLPGERRLAENYQIPLAAVRTMLDKLHQDGFVESLPRGGTRLLVLPENPKPLHGRRIGLIGYQDLSNPLSYMTTFYPLILNLEKELQEQGAELIFINIANLPKPEDIERAVREKQLDALVIDDNPDLPKRQYNFSEPSVWISEEPHSDVSICFDQKEIGHAAAEYLFRNGHRKIGLALVDDCWWSKLRVEGAQDFLRENGVESFETFPVGKDFQIGIRYFNFKSCYDFKTNLPMLAKKYTALILPNDYFAVCLLKESMHSGIRVPHDLSIISVDDQLYYRSWNLTTVQCSRVQGIKNIMTYLEKMLLEKKRYPKGKMILLKGSVVQRDTVQAIEEE